MFVVGEPTWREYSLSCRMQPTQDTAGPTVDEPFNVHVRAGLVFRVETVRRYYTFCIEDRKRLVLYRRNDEEWVELAGRDITPTSDTLTLRVTLDADGIHAECPELAVALDATDNTFTSGRAGFRALGACRLYALDVAMRPGQQAVNDQAATALAARTAQLSGSLPDETEAGIVDLSGGRSISACTDFCVAGRNDMLFKTPDGMVAETWDGKLLWTHPEPLSYIVFSSEPIDGRRIIYALTGKRAIGNVPTNLNVQGEPIDRTVHDELLTLDGATGQVLNRIKLPESPRPDMMRHFDLSVETGRISGSAPTDILVREWRADWGGGGEMIWAYDGDLNPLWEHKVYPGYGHHNAVHFFDFNGDGRDEILAGGNLLSADGEPIWRHDLADVFFKTHGGQHYDAALIGHFADDTECDPVVFLVGGSAGVYVVDGMTGRTRAHHRIGHAQWGMPCKLRDDLPGTEIMIGTRWGSYGILTLFSGRGDRLWSIQPDYVLQGTVPVQWTPDGTQHIWCNRSVMAMGLYDGYGQMVKPLNKIRKLYGGGNKKPALALRRTPDGPDLLGLQIGETLHLFGTRHS